MLLREYQQNLIATKEAHEHSLAELLHLLDKAFSCTTMKVLPIKYEFWKYSFFSKDRSVLYLIGCEMMFLEPKTEIRDLLV